MSVIVSVDSSGGLASAQAAVRLTAQEARSSGRPLDRHERLQRGPARPAAALPVGLLHTADDQRTTAEIMLSGALGVAGDV
jgi:hypothetical protein